jgi:hypothetical protein
MLLVETDAALVAIDIKADAVVLPRKYHRCFRVGSSFFQVFNSNRAEIFHLFLGETNWVNARAQQLSCSSQAWTEACHGPNGARIVAPDFDPFQ